jgi:hypothetical protein
MCQAPSGMPSYDGSKRFFQRQPEPGQPPIYIRDVTWRWLNSLLVATTERIRSVDCVLIYIRQGPQLASRASMRMPH